MNAMTLLSNVATVEKFRPLIQYSPNVINLAVRAYKNTYIEKDHRTTMFERIYEGARFLKLLNYILALDESVADRFVRSDFLEVISIAIQRDRNHENFFI